jgi:hypothetical protein
MVNTKKIFSNPLIIISGISLIVYFQTYFFGQIFFDDYGIISDPLSKVSNITNLKEIIFSKYLGGHYYRPLTLFSFYINSIIAGEQSWIYHLTNFLIHTLSSLVLFKILTKSGYNNTLALFFSLLFSVHPLFLNAVVWIAGRNDLLLGLFSLLALFSLTSYKDNKKWYKLLLFSIFLFFAVLSKESAVFFPVICISFWFLSKDKKEIGFEDIKVFLLSVASIMLYFVLRLLISPSVSLDKFSYDIFFTKIRILPETVYKIVFPFNLQVLPDFNFRNTLSGTLISVLLLVLPVIIKNINKRIYWFGIAWFIVMMVPGMLVKTMSDRGFQYWDCRAYLPAAGLFLSLTEVISKVNIRLAKKLIYGIAISCLFLFSIANIVQGRVYRNPAAFWQSAINDYPGNSFFYETLYTYHVYGNNYDEALKSIETASKLNPEQIDYYFRAVEICLKQKKLTKASGIIDKAYKYHPGNERLLAFKTCVGMQLSDAADISILQSIKNYDGLDKRKFCDEMNSVERVFFSDRDSLKCKKIIDLIRNSGNPSHSL